MARKRRGKRDQDREELLNLLERCNDGASELERFHAMLACEFDLNQVGHFLWRIERRTLSGYDRAVRCGTYDEHPLSGWRAGTPEWTDPVPCLNMATGEYTFTEPFCRLRLWISRTLLTGAEIDERGREAMNWMEQNPPTWGQVEEAINSHFKDAAAGRQAPLTASRALDKRLSGIRIPIGKSRISIATIWYGGCDVSLLEVG